MVTAVIVLVSGSVVQGIAQQTAPAAAANPALFDPGHIIDDGVFYDGAAMTAAQIQEFLNAKVPSCAGVCLKNYTAATPSIAAATGRCAAYTGSASESAATIIARVGAACGISQKALLVLLQKEQGLVTATNPSAGKFNAATGYSCPDTAACDPAYSGFFYQVYYAARQYKNYAINPTNFNHQAGRVNNIRFHPNAACGTKAVYIQNKATAGLYNYTPYTPNAAAMANINGTGDGCSSYGNRNFWRYYSDWFGSPTLGTSLVRTAANSTVYLLSDSYKYPISSGSVLAGLAPLGNVAYVAQSLLDTYVTGHTVGRSLRSPDGTIYFFDAGIKLPFASCAQAIDYGASCEPSGYVQLTDAQIAAFYPGPTLGPVLGTVEGGRYYIKDGTKREILDTQSQVALGLPSSFNVLTENAIAALPFGAPIVRDGVYIKDRSAANKYAYYGNGSLYTVPIDSAPAMGVPRLTVGSLAAASLAQLPLSATQFTGVITVNGVTNVLADGQRYEWAPGAGGLTTASVPVSTALADAYQLAGSIAPGTLVKTPEDASVYVVMDTNLKPVGSWTALLTLSEGDPVILRLPGSLLSKLPKSTIALTAGSLVRSPQDATVYLVNGITNRIPVSSFTMTLAAGIDDLEFFPQAYIEAYPMETQILGFGLTCNGVNYMTANGGLHAISAELAPLYPISFIALDVYTCRQLTILEPATQFVRTPDGSIYQLVAGQKRPILSMARYTQLRGSGAGFINIPVLFANLFPTGPAA